MANKPNKPATAAPANKPAPPPQPATPAAGDAAEPRKRNFLSPEKQLAITIAGLIVLLTKDTVQKLLSAEEQEQVTAASKVADEINQKTIKPIQDKIASIQAELRSEAAKLASAGIPSAELVKKVSDLGAELARLQKRLETFTNAAQA